MSTIPAQLQQSQNSQPIPIQLQAAQFYQVLRPRFAPGGSMRIEPNEFQAAGNILKTMKLEGKDFTEEYRKLLQLLQFYSRQQAQQASHQVPQAVPQPLNMRPEQVELFRNQLQAFQRLSQQQQITPQQQIALKNAAATFNPQEFMKSQNNSASVEVGPKFHKSEPAGVEPYSALINQLSFSTQRLIIPSLMPQGLDPNALQQEREKRIKNKISLRIKDLESYPLHSLSSDVPENLLLENGDEDSKKSNSPSRIKALIELKALKLLEKQKKIRQDVILSLKKGTTLQTAASRTDYRRVKKASLREIRYTEKMEHKHRIEREKKEKQKQHEQLNYIIQHGRDLLTLRKNLSQKQAKLGKAIVQWHTNIEKEEAKKEERLTKERIKALKADDEEAYLKLINKQKDTRLTHLLKQTDQYLDQLMTLVQAQKDDISAREGTLSSNQASSAFDEDEVDNRDYYLIAHKIKEEISDQPMIMVGGTLKDYQLKGLEWMVSLYNNKLNGILADEMGLGKTIQTISLVAHLIEKKNQNGPFLIIVPLSTITNWAIEFEKWTPSIIKVVYKGTPSQRRDVQMNEMRNNNFNVLLTTYEYIIKDKSVLSKIKWCHTIIDEGHRMKNASSKLSVTLTQFYSSRYRIILTGTPLQNNLPELWALLNFVLPKVFNSVKSFDEWFNTPFANTGEKIELNEEEQLLIIKRLHKVLRPFLLRRLKKDVESDLPDKIERVLKTPLSALQQKLYSQVRKSGAMLVDSQTDVAGKRSMGIKSINNKIMQLRKICNHPYVFPEVEDAINIHNITDETIVRVSGKFELLDRILPKLKATGHRILIFFQMTHVMNVMEDFLSWRGYKYLRLDGSTKTEDRSGMLKMFNAPDSEYFCFILSTRAGGLGLNLQTADTVIIFDSDWNPHQDLQAQDRAHRIGQTQEVRIFRLISANSIEENILARAQYKLDIDGKVIQAGKFDNKSTNEERESVLRSLFESNPEDVNDQQDVDDDDELNDILARKEEDFEIFRKIDQENRRKLEEFWKRRGLTGEPSRLLTVQELPDVYLHDFIPDEMRSSNIVQTFGRGQREKKTVRYDDGLTEEQWTRAIDNDEDLVEVAERKRKRAEKRLKSEGDEEDRSVTSSGPASSVKPKKKRRIDEDDSSGSEDEGEEDSNVSKVKVKLNLEGSAKKTKQGAKVYNFEVSENVMKEVAERCINAVNNSIAIMEDGSDRYRIDLFQELPSKEDYPDYYQIIEHPIAMNIIQNRLQNSYYRTVESFRNDFQRMFSNAMKYNAEESVVYEDAEIMRREFEEELSTAIEEFGLINNDNQ